MAPRPFGRSEAGEDAVAAHPEPHPADALAPQPASGRDAGVERCAVAVDEVTLLRSVDLGGAGRVRIRLEQHLHAAAAVGIEVGAVGLGHERGRVLRAAAEAEVAHAHPADPAGAVVEVVAVPVPQLRRLALDHRAGPVVALEVEALGRGGRHARRLLGGELDQPEVGDVLTRLVELDAERVGAGIGEVGARADVLKLAAKRDVPVVWPDHRRRRLGGRGSCAREQRADHRRRTHR